MKTVFFLLFAVTSGIYSPDSAYSLFRTDIEILRVSYLKYLSLKFLGQFLNMLDMGQMPSPVSYNKRLSPKMRRWAEPQQDSRLENFTTDPIHMLWTN